MSVGLTDLEELCNPDRHSRDTAISLSRKYAGRVGTFYLSMSDFIKRLTATTPVQFRMIDRTLEILYEIAPERVICQTLVHLFLGAAKLRSRTMQSLIARDPQLKLLHKLLQDADHRVRGNLVEGLWPVQSEAAFRLMSNAVRDTHHRVAANAVYGIYLTDPAAAIPLIEDLIKHPLPTFRSAGAWVIRQAGTEELQPLLKPLMTDTVASVRKAVIKSQLDYKLKSANGLNPQSAPDRLVPQLGGFRN